MSAALTTNVDQRLLRTTKFPPEFNVKVDMSKVNIDVLKKWITDELAKLLQTDDDVVTELVFNIIEGSRFPNIKELQISLTGFLDKDAAKFCKDLWKLCLSAQQNTQGIPKELLEAKRQELIQNRMEEEKAKEEAIKRQEAERERDRDVARIRDRERGDRGRGKGVRPGHDIDRRPTRRESRSPPPRRQHEDDDYYRAPARVDSYVPAGSRRREPPPRRRRSPSSSRSRSPPPKRSRRYSNTSRSPSPPARRRQRSSPYRSASSSRSPPRRSRYLSSSRSRSRDRGPTRKKDTYRGAARRRKSRSASRRRSRSPRRYRRRTPSPDRSRYLPSRRNRRASSSSRSPPLGARGRRVSDELMSSRGKDARRLSRASSNRSETLDGARQPNRDVAASSNHGDPTAASRSGNTKDADAVESGYSFLGASLLKQQPQQMLPIVPPFNRVANISENLRREQQLRDILLARRRDSAQSK